MKIAVASANNQVFQHFGRCEQFTIFDIEDDTIQKRDVISTADHLHGALPAFLYDLGVRVVITGGMGPGAQQKCEDLGIKSITGVQGLVDDVMEQYTAGTLQINEPQQHDHHGHQHEHNGHGQHGHNHQHGQHHCSCGHH